MAEKRIGEKKDWRKRSLAGKRLGGKEESRERGMAAKRIYFSGKNVFNL